MIMGDYRYDPPQGGKDGWYDWLVDGPYGAYASGKGKGQGKLNIDGPYGKGKCKGKAVDGKTQLLDGFAKGHVILGKGRKGSDSWTSLPIVNDSSVTQWLPMGPRPTIPHPEVYGPDVTVEATWIDGAGGKTNIIGIVIAEVDITETNMHPALSCSVPDGEAACSLASALHYGGH